MDFFEHQEAVHRKTGWLLGLFALALLCIVAAVYLVVMIALQSSSNGGYGAQPSGMWHPQIFVATTLGTLAIILSGSVYKTVALSSGGEVVARTLGGRLIQRDTSDPDERRVLNVVDEMAIASGIPCPPVYLLESELGINAFAAGYTPDDAVVGVTRGCIESLTRDELQGVVAHEFSHIFHGDMRLNIRLMALLHGILLLALAGYLVLRGGGGRGHVRRRGKGGGGGAILLLGLALLVIGYVGVFFAKLIKSAVSRQREFLADASAVQYTRNPGGLSGALQKIGGATKGSRVEHSQAEQASHLFFGNALKASMFSLLSTHPPLEERIRRIDPSFDGRFPRVERARPVQAESSPSPQHERQAMAAFATPMERKASKTAFTPDAVMQHIGSLDPGEMAAASAVLSGLPEEWRRLVYEPYGARVLVYLLLLNDDAAVRKAQLGRLAEFADANVFTLTRRLANAEPVAIETRLSLLELCIPALRELSPTQYRSFRENVTALIQADAQIGLFEFLLYRTLKTHLDPQFRLQRPSRNVKYRKLEPVLPHLAQLLSAISQTGGRDAAGAARAFRQAARELGGAAAQQLALQPADGELFARVDRALSHLASASPQIKKLTLRASAAAIESDGTTTIEERELFRTICESLGCPIPPLAGEPDA